MSRVQKANNLFGDSDYNLWAMVQLTRQVMSAAREIELSQYGISTIEASLLFVIHAIEETGKPATPAEIARWLARKPNSVTELLTRMAKKGLVRKVSSSPGSHTKRIVLTGEGQRAYDRSSERLSIHHIISRLTEDERRNLWSYLEKLRNGAMEELGAKQTAPWPTPDGWRFED
ncbi:MAG: MarR family transcriptional regulator [Chloroflexi bacterium]|nr:MarR family transcriptional regulator [Chloroflexota bacterium]